MVLAVSIDRVVIQENNSVNEIKKNENHTHDSGKDLVGKSYDVLKGRGVAEGPFTV